MVLWGIKPQNPGGNMILFVYPIAESEINRELPRAGTSSKAVQLMQAVGFIQWEMGWNFGQEIQQ